MEMSHTKSESVRVSQIQWILRDLMDSHWFKLRVAERYRWYSLFSAYKIYNGNEYT